MMMASMAGSPGCAYSGAWLMEFLKWSLPQPPRPPGTRMSALAVLRDFQELGAGSAVAGHGAEGHLQHDILALRTGAQVFAPALAVFGKHVASGTAGAAASRAASCLRG